MQKLYCAAGQTKAEGSEGTYFKPGYHVAQTPLNKIKVVVNLGKGLSLHPGKKGGKTKKEKVVVGGKPAQKRKRRLEA